ncbi:hypothetical protein OC844_008053, partial [Tilletia horrida]
AGAGHRRRAVEQDPGRPEAGRTVSPSVVGQGAGPRLGSHRGACVDWQTGDCQVGALGLSKGFLNKGKGRQGPPSTSAITSSSAAQVRDPPRGSASAKGKGEATIQDDDGFYALMDRMDAELAAVQRGGRSSGSRSATAAAAAASRTSKSRPTPADEMQLDSDEDGEEDSDGDGGSDGDSLGELDAQEAELLQKLVRSQGEALRQAGGGGGGGGSEEAEMLANFLTSLRAQGAAPGPVSNLAGRLGVGHLPRDDI